MSSAGKSTRRLWAFATGLAVGLTAAAVLLVGVGALLAANGTLVVGLYRTSGSVTSDRGEAPLVSTLERGEEGTRAVAELAVASGRAPAPTRAPAPSAVPARPAVPPAAPSVRTTESRLEAACGLPSGLLRLTNRYIAESTGEMQEMYTVRDPSRVPSRFGTGTNVYYATETRMALCIGGQRVLMAE